jgi:hypothetical protein
MAVNDSGRCTSGCAEGQSVFGAMRQRFILTRQGTGSGGTLGRLENMDM